MCTTRGRSAVGSPRAQRAEGKSTMPRGAGEPDAIIVVPDEVMTAVNKRAGGTITCAQCFEIAERAGVTRRVVGEAANRAKVRIVRCQLGCFD